MSNTNSGDNCDKLSEFDTKQLVDILDEIIDKCEANIIDQQSIDSYRRTIDSDADNDQNDDIINETVNGDKIDESSDDEDEYVEPLKHIDTIDVTKEQINSSTKSVLRRQQRQRMDTKITNDLWGESVGIYDCNGKVRRVVAVSDLHNYLLLESTGLKTDSKIYCSLISDRFPRFFDSTRNYLQRWRMRYNIFAEQVLDDKDDDSLVHIGEIHLYFDLKPQYRIPFYVNNSFYMNEIPTEKAIDLNKKDKILAVINSILNSRDILQLKFPIKSVKFHKTNEIFIKFTERQQEMMEEVKAVNRRGFKKFDVIPQRDRRPRGGQHTSQSRPSVNSNGNDFDKNKRQFNENDRQFNKNKHNFDANNRQKSQYSSDRKRGSDYGNYRNGRHFSSSNSTKRSDFANNRNANKPIAEKGEFKKRTNNYNNVNDFEVTFEDTRESQSRNVNKNFNNKTNRGFNQRRINSNRDLDVDYNYRNPQMEPSFDSSSRKNSSDIFKTSSNRGYSDMSNTANHSITGYTNFNNRQTYRI